MLSIEERQAEFDAAYKDWLDNGTKKSWDIAFMRVVDACTNIAKRLMKGKPYNPMTEERALDAAIIIMDRLKRLKYYPVTLSSYCYLPTYKELFDRKSIEYDKLVCNTDAHIFDITEGDYNDEENDYEKD